MDDADMDMLRARLRSSDFPGRQWRSWRRLLPLPLGDLAPMERPEVHFCVKDSQPPGLLLKIGNIFLSLFGSPLYTSLRSLRWPRGDNQI